MTPAESIYICFSKYAIFKGRATRSEYWWFYLFTTVAGAVIQILTTEMITSGRAAASSPGILLLGYLPALLFASPFLAVTTRRLHDVGKSGWWQFIYLTIIGIFFLLYWLTKKSDYFSNKYNVVD